ncbi:MAG: TetR/AcrR family transcriptional regulator [Deltaproteobacteria bacterium]|nr:TetR/AcrR family transcriptional regulator [Deltaproteobacteria bacterium]
MGIKERKEREKEMRQRQIITAAEKIFSAKGFRGATMEDIAREAELSPGALYTYFNKKDDLYASLNLRLLKQLVEKAEAIRKKKNLDSEGKIHAIMDMFLDVYKSEPLLFMSLFNLQSSRDLWNLSEDIVAKINELAEKSVRAIAGILEDAIGDGTIIEAHPMALTDIIWSLFSGLVLWVDSKRFSNPEKDFLMPTASLAMDIFLRGVLKQKSI